MKIQDCDMNQENGNCFNMYTTIVIYIYILKHFPLSWIISQSWIFIFYTAKQ